MSEFGDLMREARRVKEISLNDLADQLGESPAKLSGIEHGHISVPLILVIPICEALGEGNAWEAWGEAGAKDMISWLGFVAVPREGFWDGHDANDSETHGYGTVWAIEGAWEGEALPAGTRGPFMTRDEARRACKERDDG